MSLKAELEIWASALRAYDEERFEAALELFTQIADSSKILCNMGLIYATMGEHEIAVERFTEATKLDQYLAVAYFQCGVSNFLLGQYDAAHKDFGGALLYLRGNQVINYEQLGLNFRLYSAEVLFNKGLSLIYMGQIRNGLADMEEARKDKATGEHNVIDDAISDRGEGYTVFSIPVGVLYRPSEKKLKNSMTKDYLGKAILVATSDPKDNGTDFSGAARLKRGITPTGIYVDPPDFQKNSPDTPVKPRSATLSTSGPSWVEGPKSAGVESTKPNPFTGRENRSNGGDASRREFTTKPTGLSRSKTQIAPARPSPNATPGLVGGQTRMMRRSSSGNKSPSILSPKAESPISEFYSGYARDVSSANPRSGSSSSMEKVKPQSLSRSNSRNVQTSASVSSLSRQFSKRAATQSPKTSEGGYGSDSYDGSHYEMALIRVKIHHRNDVRGMTMSPDITFSEFVSKICSKFQKRMGELDIKFTDEDGMKITLRDESDFEMAIETTRSQATGRSEGKLELFCREL